MIDWRHWHNEPFLVGGLIFLGSGFLGVWQDPKYVSGELFPSSGTILSILAVATLFRCAQSCGRQALFAMREVRYLGCLVLVEAARAEADGLPISARIVDKLGGKLDFLTRLEHGTTFRIIMPACEQPE